MKQRDRLGEPVGSFVTGRRRSGISFRFCPFRRLLNDGLDCYFG